MSSDTAEIGKLRLPWETRDQWSLRSAFLHRHWDTMPQPRLLARAQAFINIEFMGCQYDETVMQEISRMGDGLTEDYKKERKATVNRVLGQDPKQKRKELRQAARERRDNTLGARKVNLNRTGDEGSQPPSTKVARRGDDNQSSQSIKMETSKPTVVQSDMQSISQAHLKSLNRVRLQLTMVVRGASTCQQLSAAVARSNIEGCANWSYEIVDERATKGGEAEEETIFKTCVVRINGIVIAALLCIPREHAEATKEHAAQVAVDKLNRLIHEMRPYSIAGVAYEHALFTGVRKEIESTAPDDQLLDIFQTRVRKLSDALKAEGVVEEGKAMNTLMNCAAKTDNELVWNTKQLKGWSAELSLSINHIRVSAPTIVKGGKAIEDSEKANICSTVIGQMRLANQRVVRTFDLRRLVLVATDDAITVAMLEAAERQLQLPSVHDHVIMHRSWLRNAIDVLSQSAQGNQCSVAFEEHVVPEGCSCTCLYDGSEVCTSIGATKFLAKQQCAYDSLKLLCQKAFVLQMKQSVDESHSAVTLNDDLKAASTSSSAPQAASVDRPMNMESKAAAMMAKMGWTSGAGLGKEQQGISEPITVQQVFFRQGLGSSAKNMNRSPALFRQSILTMLSDYARGDQVEDMVFSTDLDNEQRKIVHNLSRKFTSLRTISYGKGDNRQLTVRKQRSMHQMVRVLMVECGGETAKYKVYAPNTFPFADFIYNPTTSSDQKDSAAVVNMSRALDRASFIAPPSADMGPEDEASCPTGVKKTKKKRNKKANKQ